MHLLFVNYHVIMHFLVWSCTFFKLWTVGRYFVLNFRMPTVFDIIPIELVRFRNTESSFSISFPAIWFSLSCSYSNINVENNRGVFRPFSTEFILMCVCEYVISQWATIGPLFFYRAVLCQPTGLRCGLDMVCSFGRCLGRAKIPGLMPSSRAQTACPNISMADKMLPIGR